MKPMLHKGIALLLSLLLLAVLSACGNTTQSDSQPERPPDTSTISEPESFSDSEEEAMSNESKSSKILVAYFSLAGEQYQVGVIEEGNTSIIAHMIAEQTGADLFEIEPTTPYPDTYEGLLEISQQESAENARPEIAGTVENMDDYDTVFIGYPNWWGDMPMIVYNFLESYDFSGKTVIPFCTHGGSGLSGTEGTIADLTGAAMMDGLAIPGTTAQNDRDAAREQVTQWLREGGLIA